MKLIQAFDATQWDPSQSAGQLPLGRHKVIIEDSEVKGNNAGIGGYLALSLQVIEGPSAGSTGVMRLNLYNQNQKAVEIAHRQLSAICHAVGVYNVQDSAQLHNLPFMVEVGNQKPTQEQEEKRARGEEVTLYTEVKKVFDVNGNAPGKKTTSATAAPAAPAQAPAPATATPTPAAQPDFNVAPPSWGAPTDPAAPAQPTVPAQPAAPAWASGAPVSASAPWAQK